MRTIMIWAIVLCATLAVTDSFGAACEEHEGQAFWDCYARVSNEALRPTKQGVEYERQTTARHDPVKTPEEQAWYDAAQRARYEALREEVRELAAQKEREADRKAYVDAAALQALGLGLLGGGPIRNYASHYPPPVMQPMPGYTLPPSRPPVSCTSNTVGAYIYTNCY